MTNHTPSAWRTLVRIPMVLSFLSLRRRLLGWTRSIPSSDGLIKGLILFTKSKIPRCIRRSRKKTSKLSTYPLAKERKRYLFARNIGDAIMGQYGMLLYQQEE